MSTRFATLIGLPSDDERTVDRSDVIAFHEPTAGAQIRTKGSLYLLAQVTGADPRLGKAAREALAAIQHEYYYDLTGGVPVALGRALRVANRRLYHDRERLGIPVRARIGLVALVVQEREGHLARLGAPTAVLVRDGRMYEVPPPPAVTEHDPRPRAREVATSAGEALHVEPYTWRGPLAAGDRIALVSRQLARVIGADELKRSLLEHRPSEAVGHLERLFASRGGTGSDGILALEIAEVPATRAPHALEAVHPAEPLAGLPDRSPVPLADAVGRALHGAGDSIAAARGAVANALPRLAGLVLAFVPRRRPAFPRRISRTADIRDGRRRRVGVTGMAAVAALVAVGGTVAGLPAARPTDAIPRATVARESIADAAALLAAVDARVGGADLVDRDPERARTHLAAARAALERALAAGVTSRQLTVLLGGVEDSLDRLHRVTRIAPPAVVVDLRAELDDVEPADMVAASDGTLWVLETGRGRVLRVDPVAATATVVYRAGQALPSGDLPGDPWLIATAATDVVIIDRDRTAWRIDLAELVPRRMELSGIGRLSPETTLIAALQHRPPLEIFNLYLVDGASGELSRWTPPALIPVEYPDPPEPYLSGTPDLDPRDARDLRVDVNGWLLHAGTVTRIDFGTPRGQDEYSLDPPPDADVRPVLDYRLLDGATLGDRELLYVYDAASTRLLAFQRVDGAFVGQWLAPQTGPAHGALDDVRGLSVTSVADGPAAAYLLTASGVVRLVLE
ncbi:MAG: hypothetical protein ABI841_02760 [Chloroflexota bacterium]